MKSQNDKIKVLRIIARLNIGGPAIHTILLTHYLNNTFETKLVVGDVSEGEENMDYLLEQYNVKPVYLNTLKRELSFIGDLKSIFSIYKLIREFQPDIVHTHTAKAGAVGRSAVLLYNLVHARFGKKSIKLIHTFHGHVFNGYFNRLVTSAFIGIERLMAVFTDRIVAVSETLKYELANKYHIASGSKIKVIYNGYDLKPFLTIGKLSDVSHRRTDTADDEVFITIVGRLVPIKGHKFLIQAFSRLGFPSRLFIVGDGILKEGLVQLAEKLGIRQRVDFLGYKKDVIPVYRDADIVVLSSLNEGAPVAIIEALACEKPVIATDVGGVRDLLGDKLSLISDDVALCERGILVSPANVESIATAINYLVNNKKIGYEMGSRGRIFVSKFFTIDRLITDIKTLYAEVLE
jgi:glycosyltransferase involved in cell wall biosynthesis